MTPTAPTCHDIDILRPLEELEAMTAEELLEEIHRFEEWLDFVIDETKMLVQLLSRKTNGIASS